MQGARHLSGMIRSGNWFFSFGFRGYFTRKLHGGRRET